MVSLSGSGNDRPYQGVRLSHFTVKDLFGEFSYSIPLCLKDRVTAIVAPNGAGKTLCLRLISSLFEQKWSTFFTNKFSYILYEFTDKTSIMLVRDETDVTEESGQRQRPKVTLTIGDASDPSEEWALRNVDPRRVTPAVERYLPFLTRRGPDHWTHDVSGEGYTLQEITEEYADQLPEPYREQLYGKPPERLKRLVAEIDCHLIETQRLLILPEETPERAYYRMGSRRPSTLAITQKAKKLKDIIAADFGSYATLSQSLDRSFPGRVISDRNRLPYDDLKERLQDLDRRRTELTYAGILDRETDVPVALPEGSTLDPSMARILSIYADDNDRKLSSLSDLLGKIRLFKKLIDERFVNKDVRINREKGIEVLYRNRIVPIEALSSGEQHQLVLFFELLFEIKENALILIDEPELSLHVAWQKKFIGDLMKIIALNRFDVILATHSPQLISRWTDLVVELGNIYDETEHQVVAGDARA